MTQDKPKAFLGIERSVGGRIWRLSKADERMAEALAQRFSLPLVVGRMLSVRGVGLDEAADFLEPKLRALLPDPYVLKDMEKAANRLADAAENGEKIAIIGDYDVDGASSAALLGHFLRAVCVPFMVHIPERGDGYGPDETTMTAMAADGIKCVVTVDCGTTSTVLEPFAKQGMDIIVADHHEGEIKLPDVLAVVNPKRIDEIEDNPWRNLAAVGVTFLLVIAVNRVLRERGFYNRDNTPDEPNPVQWLDIVALGTVCDVVPLVHLNRALVSQGLKILARRQNHGIAALCDVSGVDERPTAFHLGYRLGPRINAGGRVGKSTLGVKLLLAENAHDAAEISAELNDFNEERKQIEAAVIYDAMEQVEAKTDHEYPAVFALGHNWHAGVIGIVAGRLKDRYNLPTFIMTYDDQGVLRGSSRSVTGIDIGAAVMAAKSEGLLAKGGGHIMAAGFTGTYEKSKELIDFLGQHIAAQMEETSVEPVMKIDCAVEVTGANFDLVTKLSHLAPYGAGNPQPRVVVPDVRINKADIVGMGHVRCFLSGIRSGGRLKAIAFRSADSEVGKALLAHGGKAYHIAGTLRPDTWRGREDAQLIIEDIAPAGYE